MRRKKTCSFCCIVLAGTCKWNIIISFKSAMTTTLETESYTGAKESPRKCYMCCLTLLWRLIRKESFFPLMKCCTLGKHDTHVHSQVIYHLTLLKYKYGSYKSDDCTCSYNNNKLVTYCVVLFLFKWIFQLINNLETNWCQNNVVSFLHDLTLTFLGFDFAFANSSSKYVLKQKEHQEDARDFFSLAQQVK